VRRLADNFKPYDNKIVSTPQADFGIGPVKFNMSFKTQKPTDFLVALRVEKETVEADSAFGAGCVSEQEEYDIFYDEGFSHLPLLENTSAHELGVCSASSPLHIELARTV
jgi:hypothetical protein